MAEKIEIDVNLKESLDKVVGATRGLKLDEGQKQRLEKYSRGAQLALDSNEIKEFQKNFNNIIGLFKQAAAATGNLASTIKEITDKQSILNRLINELKDKRTLAESKLTKDGTRLTKKAANQFAKESGDAQKVVTSNGKVATRDEIISLQQALAQFIQKTGKAITQVTNEDLKSIQTDSGLTFKNRSAMFAAQRYVAAEKAYTTDVQNEITGLNADITAKESEYATLTQNLTRMSEAANTGASSISNLYSEIIKLANNVNTDITNQKNKQQLENIDRGAAPDLPKDIGGLQAERNANNKGLGRALKQFSLYAFVIRGLKRAWNEAKATIKELDKYLTEQAMVTGKTRQETYALVGQYQQLALQCGATTKEIAQVTTEYMKQGKSTAEALVLTEAAVKAAKVARVSVGDSVNYLTTALNGFRLEATEAMRVSDIFASVAAASATDYDELAIALSKVASQANLAGMSIEYTTALLTKGLETTREAPETMGTALKTIIARMREMSDYGETLEGDTDINNVESQLAYVGIALKNEQGELRSTEEVLDELGKKWDRLNKNQQAALAKALAGTRQQSRLIAMMDDYERVTELQEIAMRSAGATSAQAGVYLEGMEASLNKIQVAWEKIIMTITNSEVLIGIIGTIGDMLSNIGDALEHEWMMWTMIIPLALLGVSSFITKIKLQKTFNKAQIAELKAKNKSALADKDAAIEQKKRQLAQIKENKLVWERVKAEALAVANSQYADPASKLRAQLTIAEAEKEILECTTQEVQAEAELITLVNQRTALQMESVKLGIQDMQQTSGLVGVFGQLLGLLSPILMIMMLVNGAKQRSILLSKKQAKANAIELASEKAKNKEKGKGMAATLIEKFTGQGGIAGAAIGIAIASALLIALGLGLALAASFGAFSIKSPAEKAADDVNKLSNEIYTLNQTATALANVRSKFDDLDEKVLKTNKDLEEMNSLLESAGDSLSTDEDAKYNQETYKKLEDNASRRRYLELAEEDARREANKKRQEQLNKINSLDVASKRQLLNDDTTNSAFLESQSAVRAIVNNKIYETIDALKQLEDYTDEELEATEQLTVAFMEETKALEALNYANNPDAVSNLVSELVKMDATSIFGDESNSITKRVKAFREIQNALADDEAALEALNKAYSEWNTFAEMSDDLLNFIEVTSLSIDQINELYAGYSKLQKAGIEITKEQYQKALEETMFDLDDDLSNFKDIIAMHFSDMIAEGEDFEDQWNAVVSAIGDTFATGILDMGQNMEKFQNTINSFYEKSAQWAEMKESEKMEFISDNADLFAGKGGQELLAAFESGDYNTIEAALSTQMDKRWKQQLAEVQRTLAVEEARMGEDRNEAYIALLHKYEKVLLDENKLYKASLDLRLEQEKNQLDKYKEYLEKQQEALTESLEKRKEAYEKYFEDINQEQEDADYEEDANRLITNISKLSSSTNADAMQKTAELEQELRDLEEERLKELRERAQEAVIENIDTTIEEINDKFDKLLESNQALLHAMQGDLNNPLEFMTDMIMTKADDGLTALEMQQYIQDLQGTYGSVIGNDVFENMTVREDGDHLILNISGQEVVLSSNDQQSVYLAIMDALRAIGFK